MTTKANIKDPDVRAQVSIVRNTTDPEEERLARSILSEMGKAGARARRENKAEKIKKLLTSIVDEIKSNPLMMDDVCKQAEQNQVAWDDSYRP